MGPTCFEKFSLKMKEKKIRLTELGRLGYLPDKWTNLNETTYKKILLNLMLFSHCILRKKELGTFRIGLNYCERRSIKKKSTFKCFGFGRT